MISLNLPAAALALLGLSACASIEAAHIQLPAGLDASSDRIEISGIGGGQRGAYVAGEHRGDFRRSASRMVFFDTLDLHDGGSSFSIAGPDIDGAIDVSCRMSERTITIGDISFDPKRMSYHCDFTHGGLPFPARFEIQEVREGLGGMLMKQQRRGEIALDRVILQIRSVHKLKGAAFDTATPVGYAFEMNGAPVGAVDLNGRPVITYAPGVDIAQRRAVLAGALALAVFWDPANTDPAI